VLPGLPDRPRGGRRVGATGMGSSTLEIMSNRMSAPFSYAEVRPYEVAESLDELHGPDHGLL
jgi:hypothetical protein